MSVSDPSRDTKVRWLRILVAVVAVLVVGGVVWAVLASRGEPAATASPEAIGPTVAGEDATSGTSGLGTAAPDEGLVVEGVAPTSDPALGGDVPDFVELDPVELDETAEFGTSVSARVVSTERVDGQGQGVGERSGPALAIGVELTNASGSPVSLDYVVVNLYDAAGAPGPTLSGDPRSKPFSGTLANGATAGGVYVIRLPDPDATSVRVTVSYGAEAPTVVFEGDVAA